MGLTVRSEALRWWHMGISPIPLMLHSKRPMVKWKPWEAVLPPLPLLPVWFRHHRNLGIVIRRGLVVLDFDTPHGYWFWKKEAGGLNESYTVKSRRGWHVYFWLDEPFRSIAKLERGGEVRGKGIIVVPPSVHQTGKVYTTWVDAPIQRADSIEDLGVEWQMVAEERREILPYGESPLDESTVVGRIKTAIPIGNYLQRITRIVWNGAAWMAVCPFHQDSNPSLQVHPEEGWCYCHSPFCKAHKRCDVISVAQMVWNVAPFDAIRLLAQELD